MNDVKKRRIRTVLKYTWPFYIISAVIIGIALSFLFGITHKTPVYKTLTLFISGEVDDSKKLGDSLIEKYKDKELKSVTCFSSTPNDGNYYNKLSVMGYNSCDLLILPSSVLENINISSFGLDLDENLMNSYYQGYNFYVQSDLNYGIKVNKEKVQDFMALPNEDCYMILNAKSETLGEYSKDHIKERDTTLLLAKDWGM